jgi:dihydroxyacetone synthase
MAAIGVALWKYVMRYAPHTPNYFNRDRFVLSNGKITQARLWMK